MSSLYSVLHLTECYISLCVLHLTALCATPRCTVYCTSLRVLHR